MQAVEEEENAPSSPPRSHMLMTVRVYYSISSSLLFDYPLRK